MSSLACTWDAGRWRNHASTYMSRYLQNSQVFILEWFAKFQLFWRNKPNTFNWLFQTTYWEHPMEKRAIFPASSISSNFFWKKLEEIAIFQFPPGVLKQIHFFQKKNNPAWIENITDCSFGPCRQGWRLTSPNIVLTSQDKVCWSVTLCNCEALVLWHYK